MVCGRPVLNHAQKTARRRNAKRAEGGANSSETTSAAPGLQKPGAACARCSIYMALILRNEYVCLFEGAFRNLIYGHSHLTPQNFQEIFACFLAHLKSQIWDASSACLCEGNHVHIFAPKIVRLLFPHTLRGRRFANDGIHKFPQQIMRIPAAPISHCAKLETQSPTQTNDSQF